MAIERRLTEIAGPVGGQAAHRALAQRPGRHRRRAVRARGRARATSSAVDGLHGRARRRGRAPPRLAAAGLHAPAARPAGLPRPPPARLRLDARARPRRASLRRSPGRRAAARRRRAGRRELRHRPRRLWPPSSASTASRRTRSTPSPTATSSSTTSRAAATCATHLSRLGAEIVLWSSEEFGFVELSDAWTSGSSIMPQKKNPDAAELLRAKAPRIVGAPRRAARRAARAPADLQQGPAGGQGAPLRRRRHAATCASPPRRGMIAGARFDRERMAAAASDELIAATDVADLLVRRGVPFRESHGIVAGLVRDASSRAAAVRARRPDARGALRALDDECDAGARRSRSWLESKVCEGGTSLARVREQLDARPSACSWHRARERGVLRPAGARGRPRPRRLRRAPRRRPRA